MPGWHISSGGGGGGGGTGDVVGPAASVSGNIASFDGLTGKLLQDSGVAAASVVVGPASSTDNAIARWNLATGKLLQDSSVTLTDSGIMQFGGTDNTAPALVRNGAALWVVGAADPTTVWVDLKANNLYAAASSNADAFYATGGGLAMSSTGSIFFSSNASVPGTPDLNITRIAAGQLAVNNMTNGMANNIKIATTTVNASGATSTAANLVPAGCILLGVTTRVTTAITSGDGGTSVNIGNGTDADMYGATIAFAAGTTTNLASHTASALAWKGAAESVVFTCVGGTFATGQWRVCAHLLDLTSPTS